MPRLKAPSALPQSHGEPARFLRQPWPPSRSDCIQRCHQAESGFTPLKPVCLASCQDLETQALSFSPPWKEALSLLRHTARPVLLYRTCNWHSAFLCWVGYSLQEMLFARSHFGVCLTLEYRIPSPCTSCSKSRTCRPGESGET